MKKKRILSFLLSIVILVASVCQMTNAAEIATFAVENDGDNITFTSFADLKSLSESNYDKLTKATYVGSTALTISEDITLPHNLCLDAYGKNVVISSGVTLTATSPKYNNCIFADVLTVNGTLVCDFLVVNTEIIVNGAVYNNNVVFLENEKDVAVKVIGAENIYPAQTFAGVYSNYFVKSFSDIKMAVNDAFNTPNETWYYFITSAENDILIDEDIIIPANCVFTSDYYGDMLTLTIGKNAKVQFNCETYIYTPLVIEGVLINNNYLDVYYDFGGCLEVKEGGKFINTGNLYVTGIGLSAPETALEGIDTESFEITENKDEVPYWKLISKCGHSLEDYETVVTKPTCKDEGNTSNVCKKCGDFYIISKLPATNNHQYSSSLDESCDVCGYIREVVIPSVPMFRMYDPNGGEHFYTGSEEERDFLVSAGWNYEGVGFNFPVVGSPVHRLYEPETGEHLYTMNEAEKEKLISEGWEYEGVAFNSAKTTDVPQYRLHNPNASRGAYHFTGSEEEKDFLISLGWEYQGIGFYSSIR